MCPRHALTNSLPLWSARRICYLSIVRPLSLILATLLGGALSAQDSTHFSQVMDAERSYHVYLPGSYATDQQKRYPAIYWLHGFEASSIRDAHTKAFADYAAAHNVVIVDSGPAETPGQFPLYLPELIEHIDGAVRTLPDRNHRGVSGYGLGGFLAHWSAAKFPDLIASASDVAGITKASLGPEGFAVDCSLDDLRPALDGIASLYNAADADGALDFHMQAFAAPPAKPAVFRHIDPYPNFSIWGWEVASDRREPGFSYLDAVSSHGFHSVVREWLPGGDTLTNVKLSIEMPPHTFPARSTQPVTVVHVGDGKVRHGVQKVDADGRLSFDLDGDEYEVGISAEPVIAVSGFNVADAGWASVGAIKLRVKFWNLGAARSGTIPVAWESPNEHVKIDDPSGRLVALNSGQSMDLPMEFRYDGPAPAAARLIALVAGNRLSIDVPVFPTAPESKDYVIADGRALDHIEHGSQKIKSTLGQGNGDGFAAPGESFAILIPDGDSYRLAELFTNDPFVDNTVRESDDWGAGVSVNYSVPTIRKECDPGRRIRFLARIYTQSPTGPLPRYVWIELPVWYRNK